MGESDRIQRMTDQVSSSADRKVPQEAGADPLVAMLRAGSAEALSSLYTRHYPGMLAFARSYLHDSALAEDLVQDTWARIIEAVPKFKGRSSFETWAFKILANNARTRRRRESRLFAIKHLLGLQSEKGPKALPHIPNQPWSPTPEELMLSEEFRQEMHRFIASLPLRQRQVYVLRDIEGRTPEAICKLLGISNANQRVILHRARATIYEWYSARSRDHALNSTSTGQASLL